MYNFRNGLLYNGPIFFYRFYEWLKKGKNRTPYFIKRKDGNLFLFAGLYDCVKFEGKIFITLLFISIKLLLC